MLGIVRDHTKSTEPLTERVSIGDPDRKDLFYEGKLGFARVVKYAGRRGGVGRLLLDDPKDWLCAYRKARR